MAKAPRKSYKKAGGYKKQGPSAAEKASQELQAEVLEFWKAIGQSELKSWDKPWVYNMLKAENAGNYLLDKERYVYKGGFNQFIVAFQARNKETEMAPLVMTGGSIAQMFFGEQKDIDPKEKKKFGDTPVVKEHHVKSLCSLFLKPEEYNETIWKKPDGSVWRDAEKRHPTKKDIEDQELTKTMQKRMSFKTFAVWSAEDVKDYLPKEYQDKLEKLVELRRGKGYDFKPEDDIEKFIEGEIDATIKRQGIEVKESGNEAFYMPSEDRIQKPRKEQFINPIVRYAVTMHELAHSTMYLAGRKPNISNKIEYAKEEILAETTAVMSVKQLERSMADVLPKRPDIRMMFEDYYQNAIAYNQSWGSKFNFLDAVKDIESSLSEDKGAVKSILVGVAKSMDILNNQEFTPEQRKELKEQTLGLKKPVVEHKREPEPEETTGMGM